MNLIELNVNRISYSQSQNGAYALILEEVDGERKLPIVIGPCNAGSIAIYLESDQNPERPLTHDIIKSLTNSFSITISRVVIHTLLEGVFHASFFCFLDGDEAEDDEARSQLIFEIERQLRNDGLQDVSSIDLQKLLEAFE